MAGSGAGLVTPQKPPRKPWILVETEFGGKSRLLACAAGMRGWFRFPHDEPSPSVTSFPAGLSVGLLVGLWEPGGVAELKLRAG
jgi:hypothetical protein